MTEIETRSLDALYRAAAADGKLVVYAGGDLPGANDYIADAFHARFPKIDIQIITDLSKYHDMRIDQQIAQGRLECDVAHLQTIHDYDRWKSAGQLELYRPRGWDVVYNEMKDPDGAFTAVNIYSFSNIVHKSVSAADAPRDATDYLYKKWRGKIVLTYPHDDDAVLFQFNAIVQKYGWGYLDKLMRQDVMWIRGTSPIVDIINRGEKLVTFTAAAPLRPGKNSRFILPRDDRFLAWPQMAAIFKNAPHKNAAKLYMNWMMDAVRQKEMEFQWSVRRDVPSPARYRPIFEYNTDISAFRRFMADRAGLERLRGQFEQIIGPAHGPNPTAVQSGVYLFA